MLCASTIWEWSKKNSVNYWVAKYHLNIFSTFLFLTSSVLLRNYTVSPKTQISLGSQEFKQLQIEEWNTNELGDEGIISTQSLLTSRTCRFCIGMGWKSSLSICFVNFFIKPIENIISKLASEVSISLKAWNPMFAFLESTSPSNVCLSPYIELILQTCKRYNLIQWKVLLVKSLIIPSLIFGLFLFFYWLIL